ncbi:uncharacterized protein EAE97_000390 [Botrytis byssoidea]|uniref:Fungal N-terminal domain-containing protein n=1 Tax=Botrytis byssoidea TaxID=139641 RepID=A0A9P5IZ03_9HELO|nr:uncharacterized protein EAE97_000390 [Botrytis byssoidea]KAF7955131.1 hypothetical protein EAE97_000390 [Botrytis byssoidea]
MDLLSRGLKESGELGKASKLQRKVFEYNKENRRDDAPIFLKSLFEVTKTLIELGITEEAEQLYRAAIDLQVKLLGEAHVTTLKIKIDCLQKSSASQVPGAVLDGDKEGDAKILGFMDDLGSRLQNLNRMLRYLAKKEKAEELAKDALQRLKESCGEESIEFRRWNEDCGSKWIEKTNKVLKDLDAYYEQVLGSADDVTDEERDRIMGQEDEDEDAKERYAALGPWGKETMRTIDMRNAGISEGSGHGSKSDLVEQR